MEESGFLILKVMPLYIHSSAYACSESQGLSSNGFNLNVFWVLIKLLEPVKIQKMSVTSSYRIISDLLSDLLLQSSQILSSTLLWFVLSMQLCHCRGDLDPFFILREDGAAILGHYPKEGRYGDSDEVKRSIEVYKWVTGLDGGNLGHRSLLLMEMVWR